MNPLAGGSHHDKSLRAEFASCALQTAWTGRQKSPIKRTNAQETKFREMSAGNPRRNAALHLGRARLGWRNLEQLSCSELTGIPV
jgi:hypothetical protein